MYLHIPLLGGMLWGMLRSACTTLIQSVWYIYYNFQPILEGRGRDPSSIQSTAGQATHACFFFTVQAVTQGLILTFIAKYL